MKYDYSFFEKHAETSRRYFGSISGVYSALIAVYKAASAVEPMLQEERRADGEAFVAKGAYFNGGESISALEAILRTPLPDDFKQFFEQFGECAIITRTEPVWIYSLQQMIDDFEDDPDVDYSEGRFFRFARFNAHPCYLGLRKNEETERWEVVFCTYGLLYSEMIGPQGRGNIVAPSFYDWLKNLIETNGCPDNIFPHDEHFKYLSVIEET